MSTTDETAKSRQEILAGALDALRSEITELDAVEEPTDEQAARMEAILPEWDTKKAEHDRLVARAEKVEAVRSADIKPTNREAGFGAPNVIVRTDPFDNMDAVRHTPDDMLVDRARSAFEDAKQTRGVSDKAVEAVLDRIENIPGAARHALVHGSPAYRSAFAEYLKTQGQNPLYSPEQQDAVRASLSLTGANGGYTLPTLLDPTLIHTGTAVRNPIRDIARVVEGTQNVWHGVSVGNVATYWVAENSALTDGTPTMASPAITAGKLTAYVTGSYEIFEDSNLQSQLPGLIAESFSYAEQTAFISGSGSNGPKGIVTAISATAGSTVTATTRGAFTTASAVDVFALLGSLPSRYEDNATWVANKSFFNIVRQMSTGSNGSYFWSDLNAGIGMNLLGSPVKQASDMTNATVSGTVGAVLGDFSQYVIYDRLGTQVEFVQNVVDSSGLPLGQRGLIAHKRVGGDVTDVNAFRFLKY